MPPGQILRITVTAATATDLQAVYLLDLDADGDTLPDSQEAGADPHAPVDADNNGIPDYLQAAATLKQLYLPLIQR